MKNKTLLIASLWLCTLTMTWCGPKNVWDVNYNLSTEMGRQLHCYAEFQRDHTAKEYWAEWLGEVNNGFETIVEWKVKADWKEYYLVCNYSDDIGDWTINATPISEWTAIGNPASKYCVDNWWSFEITSDEVGIYGLCKFNDGSVCDEWDYFNWECNIWDSLNEIWNETNWFDLENENGRIAACEERAWFYLNFNEWTFAWENEEEAGASFVRNGRVHYTKWWETADRNVSCQIDMIVNSVTVEFPEENTNIYCTDEEKQADTCIMIYDPVCGDDDKTYWNSCSACSSKNIDFYTQWECENKE